MKIIVPMAGMGKRMRPHTLTVPKPLLPIAGKPIVQRLVEDIASVADEKITDIAFVTGRFGSETEERLLKVADNLGAKGHICYQDEALGTAHAILCAKELLDGNVIVAFADTLFKADFKFNAEKDGVLWVQKIEDPSQFGVVKINDNGVITDYVEKPKEYVSDLAMIGIYYFKDGATLRKELEYLIENDIIKGGEYQLPDALRNMTEKGMEFVPGEVEEWLDCGNKNATVHTNSRILAFNSDKDQKDSSAKIKNSIINEPCYLGENVVIENSVVGPHVSIHENTTVKDSVIKNSIVYTNTVIEGLNADNSMIGNHVTFKSEPKDLSIGDYSKQ
ncbi:sugar phosphate nucleotidyltransferase [Salibacter halophilus]|uniref:NTP transferase domain-containing protein n=1 Tax=Salibacter halophilus TaxID=1803916 RepID=A0A6N6M3Q0_9FLAO|nr:sugar phosphate nucleotidyltransferase [Salibacter halophilus]KAB1063910.1 NTP transferase domain-containing protein [Salibacter halophilus]